MYLSRVQLDIKKRQTIKALSIKSMFHGAVENSFSGERKRKLWRLDRLNGNYYLLILSQEKPDLSNVESQFGVIGTAEIKDYDQLLERILAGKEWRFRLTANPTHSKKTENDGRGVRGKVYAHITPEYQKKWLIERSESNGFYIDENDFEIVEEHWNEFRKGSKRRKISILSVSYEGILKVTDASLFKKALTNGLGRGKAYGNGMLTVMSIR